MPSLCQNFVVIRSDHVHPTNHYCNNLQIESCAAISRFSKLYPLSFLVLWSIHEILYPDFSRHKDERTKKTLALENLEDIIQRIERLLHNFQSIGCYSNDQGGHGRNESLQSSNTMKAYANGSISRQYFFDTNYFHLLPGLRSFQKSEQ